MAERHRQFVREVGSVVLGVLIALGIGEIADAIRWKLRVESSMQSIRDELSPSHTNLVERLAYQGCLDTRLAQIGEILRTARRTGVLPEVHSVGNPSARLFVSAAFDVAKAEGTPRHMDRTRAQEVATLYEMLEVVRTLAEQERRSWGTLRLIEGPGGAVSDGLLTALSVAWSDATANAWLLKLAVSQGEAVLIEAGVPIMVDEESPSRDAWFEKTSRNHNLCKLAHGVVSTANPVPAQRGE